jgi:hypothetical protein
MKLLILFWDSEDTSIQCCQAGAGAKVSVAKGLKVRPQSSKGAAQNAVLPEKLTVKFLADLP